MSQAEELLNSLSESVAEHTHPVTDADTYFIIDPVTREIENTNRKKTVIMQYDHNSERFTFQLPRYIDGHDMLQCNSVVVNVDNIEAETGNTNSDAHAMTDLRINPDDDETVISSWLISRNSTQLAGNLSFSIEYKCVADDGEVLYEFGTDSYDDIEVRARKKNGEASVIEYTDTLEQWRTQIFGAGDSVMNNITAEGEAQVTAVKAESNTQQAAVELKGAQTLESIPEDYTETNNMAEEAVRSKSNAIVCESDGEIVRLNDSSNDHIRGLKLFGKTTQSTTTGSQLLPTDELAARTDRGITQEIKNGVCIVKGTAESTAAFNLTIYGSYYRTEPLFTLEPGTYTVKDCMLVSYDGSKQKKHQDTTFTLTEPFGVTWVATRSYNPGEVVNETTHPMLNAGDKALPWEPYTGGVASPNPDYPQEIVSVENPKVYVYSKNLIDFEAIEKSANTSLDISDDGYTITLVGGATYPYTSSHIMLDVEQYRGRTVIFKQDSVTYTVKSGRGCAQLAVKTPEKTTYLALSETTPCIEVVIPDDVISITVGLYSNNTNTILDTDNIVVIKGLMLAFTDGEWEHYKPVQSLSVTRFIPGIPVTSGGNYTDENGQQWICDEVDFERGVYIQRIHSSTITPEKINSVDNAYVSTGGSIAYFVPTYQHMQNDDLCLVMSDWCVGVPCKERNTRTDEYRCYAPASDPNVITLRYPISAGEKTLDEAKRDFGGRSVMYALSEPIETPLTAEEITAFKALRTNCPNTTILNDAGAWMSVKYNADTKTYVEKPKTLKLVDSSTGVVYELKIVDGNLTVMQV